MKKLLTYLVALLLIMVAISCRTKQLPPDTQVNNSSSTSKVTEKEKTDNTKAIIDSLRLLLAKVKTSKPECDSICQAEVDKAYSLLNMMKQSGDNSYELKYDALKRQLDLVLKVAAAKNTEKTIIKETDKNSDSQGIKYVQVKVIPDFYRYSAYLGWAAAAFIGLRIFQKIGARWPGVRLLS